MNKSALKLMALLLSFTMSTNATVFVSATSKDHPFERSQWSLEECQAWQEEYGPIRGLNGCYSGPGSLTQAELIAKAHELGFNSIRTWIGGSNGAGIINSIDNALASIAKYKDMTLSPVLIPQGFYPNNKANWEKALREVMAHYRGNKKIVLWDLWNEPEMYNNTETTQQMQWIKDMVKWCREEGATQPLTASIVWDAGISSCSATGGLYTVREEAEKMMDIHNFHDYGVQESHGAEVTAMVNRFKRIDSGNNRPLVCTECMTHSNGSGVARTLTEFSKYHINFYVWGLYTCDRNWEVAWGRSCFYAWEPSFHNLLYASGEPFNPADLPFIKNFHFAEQGEATDPGAEYTERWCTRRACKWMSRKATRGYFCSSISDANNFITQHASDGKYNSISVQLKLSEYQANMSAYINNIKSLLTAADAAGMTVLPILLTNDDFKSATLSALQAYVEKIVGTLYADNRVMGWNIFRQTSDDNLSKINSMICKVMRYVRFNFPCQPMFLTPLLTEEVKADTTAQDFKNLLWKLSDVVSYNENGATLSKEWLRNLSLIYERPLFAPSCKTIPTSAAENHINWYVTQETEEAKDFDFKPFATRDIEPGEKWPMWKVWLWMNRGEQKGLYTASTSEALNMIDANGSKKLYNSIRVLLDLNSYRTDSVAFYADFDNVLTKAEKAGMNVLPTLMTDKYIISGINYVKQYTYGLLTRYADDERILAWDLYYKPNYSNTNAAAMTKVEAMFELARKVNPLQPVFATPNVTMDNFAEGYDYITVLIHGNSDGGWCNLKYGYSSVASCYKIWCLSDVIAYPSYLKMAETGTLNYVAYTFGRPILCTEWKPNAAEEPTEVMKVFDDSHVNWYVNGTLKDEDVEKFHFSPIITKH